MEAIGRCLLWNGGIVRQEALTEFNLPYVTIYGWKTEAFTGLVKPPGFPYLISQSGGCD